MTGASLADTLATAPVDAAARALLAVAAEEDDRSQRNELPPYADQLPPALVATAPARVARLVEPLTGRELQRVLFGSFRQIPWPWLDALAAHLAAPTLAGLLDAMAVGIDAPRQAARLLSARAAAGTEVAVLEAVLPASGARVVGLADMATLRALCGRSAAPRWLDRLRPSAAPAELLRIESATAPGEASVLEPVPLALPGIAHRLARLTTGEVVDRLRARSGAWQRAVLEALPADVAAAVLVAWAGADAAHAGRLLAALTEWALRKREGDRARVLYRARAAAVLDGASPGGAHQLVGLLDDHTAALVQQRRRRVPPPARGTYPEPPRPVAPPHRRALAGGVVLERHAAAFPDRHGGLPVRIDLAELDLGALTVRVRHTGRTVPFEWMAARTGDASRGDARPQEALFRDLGLVRLSEAVQGAGAAGGINGGFYLDYGHYLDALDLGIDLATEPHVRLGDAIGWFVSDGRQRTPPGVSRATLVVDQAGGVHIRRVAARAVRVRGVELTWDVVDAPGPGAVLHTRLGAGTTPASPEVVDLTVSQGVVVGIRPGGGSPVPLLGFVLSVPARDAGLLADVAVGEEVEVVADLPPGAPPVLEAMACGPLLVRDGQVDIDFAREGFGDKDAGLPPLSLTRAVDSFRAARSFLLLREGRLVFGTVSGTQVGHGPVGVSIGVTFGELAALCVELGADTAMALDGGGSSTLVVAGPDGPVVANVPTGGADVPPGAERFIATYLLAVPRR